MVCAIWLFLILATITLFYVHRIFYTRYDRNFINLAMQFPGPRWLPIIGTTYTFGMNPDSLLQTLIHLCKLYQPISGHWIGPEFYTIISKPKDIEVILNSKTSTEKGHHVYKILANCFGDGLVTSKEEKWKKHRKLMNPMFYSHVLKQFISIFYSKVRHTCDLLEIQANNNEFDIFPYIEHCNLRILIATTVTEVYDTEYNYECAELMEHINVIREIIVYKMTKQYSSSVYTKLLGGKHVNSSMQYPKKLLLKMAEKTKTRIHLKSTSDKAVGSFLEFMFRMQTDLAEGLSDEEILDEVRTLVAVAFETCTAAVGFTLFLLSRHPDIQDKVVDEIRQEFGSLEDEPITYENISRLKYLDRVVKESLRLYPPLPYIVRHVLEDVKLPSGYTLPGGSNALLMFYCMHRDPEVFPEPDEFDPDNFLPRRVAARFPTAFAPFSFGPRNCIGQRYAMLSIKTQVAAIVRKFILTPSEVEPNLIAAVGLKSSNGLHVAISRRGAKK